MAIEQPVNRELSCRICEMLGLDSMGVKKLVLTIEVGQVPVVAVERIVHKFFDSTSLDGAPFRCSETLPRVVKERRRVEWGAPSDVITCTEDE